MFPGVPFQFGALLGRRTGFDQAGLPSLRAAMVAGGAMAPRLVAAFRRHFPDADLHLMYGQTEASARLSALPPDDLAGRCGSIGRGIPGVELAVLGPDGLAVAPGEVGDLYARGENVMRGYLGDAAASAEVLTPWGLRTRDLARVDADGYIYLVGRSSDFAKVRGNRVSLVSLEERIESCSEVSEAVVLSEPDDRDGETLVAEVVLGPSAGPQAQLQSLRSRLRASLPAAERPRQFRVVDSIPRTASGKKIRWRK